MVSRAYSHPVEGIPPGSCSSLPPSPIGPPPKRGRVRGLSWAASLRGARSRLLLGLFLSLDDRRRLRPVLRDQFLQGSPDADEPLLPVAPRIGVAWVPVCSVFVYIQGRTRPTEVGFQSALHAKDGPLSGVGPDERFVVEPEHVVELRHIDGLSLQTELRELLQLLQGVIDRHGE